MLAEKIRNIRKGLLARTCDGTIGPNHFRIAFENLDAIADAVERLEAMAVPDAPRVQVADLEDGTVVRLDEFRLQRAGVEIWPGGAE